MKKNNTNCGIYRITNKVNGRFYIGSSGDLHRRLINHLGDLRRGAHKNQLMQDDYVSDGQWEFKVIQYCVKDELFDLEQAYLNKYWDNGLKCYNVDKFAAPCSENITEEKKAVISAAAKRDWANPEHRAMRLAAQKAALNSPEGKAAIAAARTPEHNAQTSEIVSRLWSDPDYIAKQKAVRGSKEYRENMARIQREMNRAKAVVFISPEGVEETVTNIKNWCIAKGYAFSSFYELAKGKKTSAKGWTLKSPA